MRRNTTHTPTSVVLILFLVSITGWAQDAEIDSFKLQRDLKIMENILDRLLDDGQNPMHSVSESRGMYVQGYGMVFYTTRFQPLSEVIVTTFYNNHEEMRAQKNTGIAYRETGIHYRISESPTPYSDVLFAKARASEKRTLQNIKMGVLEFLLNYAPSTSQLGKNDRIALLVNLNSWRILDPANHFISAWINLKEAIQYRVNRMPLNEDLLDCVNYTHMETPDQVQKDIDILSAIFDEAMTTGTASRHISTAGVYVKHLGALFFIELQDNFSTHHPDTSFSFSFDNAHDMHGMNAAPGQASSTQASSSSYITLHNELLELLAIYGHTVQLEPYEQIILDVNHGPRLPYLMRSPRTAGHFRIQIEKRHLDDYSNHKIDMNQLKQNALIQSS